MSSSEKLPPDAPVKPTNAESDHENLAISTSYEVVKVLSGSSRSVIVSVSVVPSYIRSTLLVLWLRSSMFDVGGRKSMDWSGTSGGSAASRTVGERPSVKMPVEFGPSETF